MKTMQMEAKIRTAAKKGAVGRLRAEKKIPAVMYGKGEPAVPLELTPKEVQQVIHTPSGLNVLIKLSLDEQGTPRQETVMIKEIQRHPVSSAILHVDLVKISMDQKLEIKIPVVITGTAPGIKEGGILELVHRELAIRCLPSLIPENVTLDVSALNIGDAITVAQLPVQEGVEILVAGHEPIVHVVLPKLEEEKPAAEAAVEGAVAAVAAPEAKEPEVIGEKEREERRAEKEKTKKE
jgi:large subunit ribosomal protein L25